MIVIRKLTAAITFFFICSGLMAQADLSARQIAARSYEAGKLAGSESISTMTIVDSKQRERVRKIAQVSKLYDSGDTEKKLIRFLSPADVKGTGLLTFDYKDEDDDMWLYMPALRKTRRIISSEKAKNFMGSEFSYSDITPPTIADFHYTKLGEQRVANTLCWELEILPINEDIADENGFSKKISFIGQQDFVIRKAVYYDLDGELLKELEVREVMEVDTENHKYRPVHMIMTNKQNNRKSILKVEKIQINHGVKDEYFTTRYLERE